jgi:hypothetical protein
MRGPSRSLCYQWEHIDTSAYRTADRVAWAYTDGMRKWLSVLLASAVFVLVAVSPDEARGAAGGPGAAHGGGHWSGGSPSGHWDGGHHHFHHHGRAAVFIADRWWVWGPDPYWWYYPPPPVILQEPAPVYIEPWAPGYWYYCPSAGAYYPTVSGCAQPWVQVAPRSP